MYETMNMPADVTGTGKRSQDMRIKQMKGRILLGAAGSKVNKKGKFYSRKGYYASDENNRILASIEPGREYRTSMELMSLRNAQETLEALMSASIQLENAGINTAADAVIRILNHLEQHKWNLNEIWLLWLSQKQFALSCIRSYIAAFAGAMDAGAEDIFLSLDGKQLTHALSAGEPKKTMYRLFQLLPYFERTEYIFHAMKNQQITSVLTCVDPAQMNVCEKQMFGSKRFLASKILKNVGCYYAKSAVSLCASSQEIFRFLEYLAASLPDWACGAAVVDGLGNLTDAELYIQILELLKDSPGCQEQTFRLMDASGYDRKLAYALHRKIQKDAARYIAKTEGMSSCMMAAWVLGKGVVLSYRLSKWWKEEYEETVLYAMLHKWNRFIADLVYNEELREAADYLSGKCSQINANMLSSQQIIKICKEDMLPEKDTVPEWMRPATYDQIAALHEIQKPRNIGCRNILIEILRKLTENVRPEMAGKRMFQFVQAWSSSTVNQTINEQESEEIASCLQEQDIYAWGIQTFSFHPSRALAAAALPYLRGLPAFSEAVTEQDAWFILRNLELCRDGLEKAKESFCQSDPNVQKLKMMLKLEAAFYQKYKKESTDFFLSSTDITNTYASGLSEAELRKFRLIVKAAMCGRLNELKFHEGDLTSEISILVNRQMANTWIHDLSISDIKDKFGGACMEDSTFNGIMTMGTLPSSTCMDYRDGVRKECLMSYFDANKKIIYRTNRNGQVIARAVLRFTKAIDAGAKKSNRLNFVDVETAQEKKEFPILFLERMYSGYQGQDRATLAQSLIEAAKEKADEMGVGLVLAHDYAGIADIRQDAFMSGRLSVYITKSKSSAQYLDSFGGKQTYDNGEDTYMEADCVIAR